MFKTIFSLFNQYLHRPLKPDTPQILNFKLGSVVSLDKLKVTLIEEKLITGDAKTTQHISAVGLINISKKICLYRFYTEEGDFFQVSQNSETGS